MISLEKDLEQARVSLTLKSDMNLPDAFAIFDLNGDGILTPAEIREGLAAIGVYPTS